MSTAGAIAGLGRVELAAQDHDEAGRLYDRAAEVARQHDEKQVLVHALNARGRLYRRAGRAKRAAELLVEALDLARAIPDWSAVAVSLDAMAGIAADTGSFERAARLLGAADTLRSAHDVDKPTPPLPERDAARDALGPDTFDAAWHAGSALSPDEAAAYACRRRPHSNRAATGWTSLSDIERHVVALVSEGLTNAEVARRLFISPRTVGNHLSRIYPRVGVTTRTQLANVARQHEANATKSRST